MHTGEIIRPAGFRNYTFSAAQAQTLSLSGVLGVMQALEPGDTLRINGQPCVVVRHLKREEALARLEAVRPGAAAMRPPAGVYFVEVSMD